MIDKGIVGNSCSFIFIIAIVMAVMALVSCVTKCTDVSYDGAASGTFDVEKIVILIVSLVFLYLIAQLFAFLQNFGMVKITVKVMQSLFLTDPKHRMGEIDKNK